MARLNPVTGQLEDYWPDPFQPPNDGRATMGGRTISEDPQPDPGPDPQPSPSPPPSPNPTPNPSPSPSPSPSPDPFPTPPASSDPYGTEIANHIKQWTNGRTGYNPSVTNDPGYWAGRIRATSPNGNPDWGYWESRFMQPEGPPEGTTNNTNPTIRLGRPTGPDVGTGLPNQPGPSPNDPTNPGGDNSPLSSFLQQLMGRANSLMDLYSKPVSGSDPNIRNVTDAYHGRMARSLSDYREKMAERAHAEGVPTGAFDAQLGNATTTAGRGESELEAQLVNMENENRRSALTSMFGGATSLGLGDKGLNIQDFLGRGGLSNQLLLGTGSLANQNLGINNQNKQFYDQLAWLMSQYGPNMDSVLTQLLMGGR